MMEEYDLSETDLIYSIDDLRKQNKPEEFIKAYAKEIARRQTFNIPLIKDETKKIEEAKLILGKTFEDIKDIISYYVDMPENYKTLITLWIIGTYFHQNFETYPYLFFNAMRGSGKTRTLKIITNLAWNGQLLASVTESVLFRSNGTLAIDEFESVGSKEKQALRELLNAGYKKGIKIKRMKKVSKRNELGLKEEIQEMEEFEAYRPIVMANIWGMDEVLGDRCINITLEKSSSIRHTKKIEDFSSNEKILAIKSALNQIQCSLCNVVTQKNIIEEWNDYINTKYNNTQNTLNYINTFTTSNYTKYIIKEEMFKEIDNTNLDGRYLELYFPLFIIAKTIADSVFKEILKIATGLVEEKRIDETMESKDVMLFDFISRKYEAGQWMSVNELTKQFRDYIGDDERAESWLNAKWFGRALKRLCLIIEKKRLGQGMQVIINKAKAEEKMKIFR